MFTEQLLRPRRRACFFLSLTEFVYPGYWHFEKGSEVWKFHDILLGHGGTKDLGTGLDKKVKIETVESIGGHHFLFFTSSRSIKHIGVTCLD